MHRLPGDDARRLDFDAGTLGGLDGTLAVDGLAGAVNDAAQQFLADRHVDDGAGALDDVAFLDGAIVAENNDADVVGLQVEGHPLDGAGKLDHLAGLHLVEAVDAGNAVAHRQHLADFGDFRLGPEIGDLFLQDCGDFRRPNIH